MPKIVFFDLDRTLFSYNSAMGWVRREFRLGYICWWDALKACWWFFLYALGVAGLDCAIRKAALRAKGRSEEEVRERARSFWEEEAIEKIRYQAFSVIEKHRSLGHQLAIITSSSDYIGQLACDLWGVPHALSNRLRTVDGVFTGALVEPLCYGRGKLARARNFADQQGVSLRDCVFYTDSYSDLDLLNEVGSPVAVHPDYRLAREAKRRGWKIVYWQ